MPSLPERKIDAVEIRFAAPESHQNLILLVSAMVLPSYALHWFRPARAGFEGTPHNEASILECARLDYEWVTLRFGQVLITVTVYSYTSPSCVEFLWLNLDLIKRIKEKFNLESDCCLQHC